MARAMRVSPSVMRRWIRGSLVPPWRRVKSMATLWGGDPRLLGLGAAIQRSLSIDRHGVRGRRPHRAERQANRTRCAAPAHRAIDGSSPCRSVRTDERRRSAARPRRRLPRRDRRGAGRDGGDAEQGLRRPDADATGSLGFRQLIKVVTRERGAARAASSSTRGTTSSRQPATVFSDAAWRRSRPRTSAPGDAPRDGLPVSRRATSRPTSPVRRTRGVSGPRGRAGRRGPGHDGHRR
jgi:hypothetical protein